MVERAHHNDLHMLKSIEQITSWTPCTNIESKGGFLAMKRKEMINPTNPRI